MILFLIVLVFVGCSARPDTCQYGDWEECSSTSVCSEHVNYGRGKSFSLPESSAYDAGRAMMSMIMEEKLSQAEAKDKCVAEGSCPQFVSRVRSEGTIQCEEGVAGTFPDGGGNPKSCRNVDQISFIDLDELDMEYNSAYGRKSNDVWGWVDPSNDDEYVIHGMTTGTSFVRITDAARPTVVAFLPSVSGRRSTWRDIKVINDHAFIGSEASGHGMQIFDLTRLRRETGVVESDVHYTGVGNSHNIVANEDSNTIYIVGATQSGYNGCSGGLHMVDVSNPKSPRFSGCYSGDGYTHDAQCVIYRGPDTSFSGKEVCFAFNEDSVTIVDTTDKSNPVMIAKESYDRVKYCHQGWLTEDHTTVLLDDEQDEVYSSSSSQNTLTYLWDVRDLAQPKLQETYASAVHAIDHNQYVLGNWTFQSNYEAGLRILRIEQDTFTLTEMGHFDVINDDTNDGRVEFDGTWSNYPYFPSGNVAVTSVEYGLYIVRPDLKRMEFEYIIDHHGVQSKRSITNQCPALTRACQSTNCL